MTETGNRKPKNRIIIMIVFVLMVAACGGREPEPVMVTRFGDENKNCKILIYDIENLEFEIHKLLPETKGKTMKNIGYGVAGFYTFFIPWLLIDFQNAEAKEYEALRARHAHLAEISTSKECRIAPQQYPSLDEVKKDYAIFKKNKAQGEPQKIN